MRLLTWNLFHGRSVPDTPHELLVAFGERLAGWEWDVALLQEVPPWWAEPLARATEAEPRAVLTSRHELLPLRRALARRRPDLLKSNGGGSNAILVRPSAGEIAAHERHRLRTWPERRVAHAVALSGGAAGDGLWVANVHCSTGGRAPADVVHAASWLARRAGPGATRILGGDLNTRRPSPPGLAVVASSHVDHVCATEDLCTTAPGTRPPREVGAGGRAVALSDHAPLAVTLARRPQGDG